MITVKSLVRGLAAALTLVALAGCTINLGTDQGPRPGMMNGRDDGSGFSSADIMFAQMMIPHHEQAVEMSTLAETHTTTPEVLALAAQIKAAQAPEIEQMRGWLDEAGAPAEMGGSMGMNGMLSDNEMAALADASGASFDTLYLTGMIAHHEGAIQMAQMVLNSDNAEAKALGENIVESQTEEIALMKKMLAEQQ
jgi:uncharacterized protein (DUF305 family)